MDKRRLKIVARILVRKYRGVFFLMILGIISQVCIFLLYDLNLEPVVYSYVLLAFVGILLLIVQAFSEYKKSEERERSMKGILDDWRSLSDSSDLVEEDYSNMIRTLGKAMEDLKINYQESQQESLDYYTTWVHQIKTPIAVMRLLLSREDTKENQALLAELFRIEQYVDMVLQYIRLGSTSNDLVIREYELDELIRQTIRKYASQFIARELGFSFKPSGRKIVTDQKWFTMILEQLISNAIKYTPSGSIAIEVTEDGFLYVKDTGIGIAQEDLPRIFERGFTGNNGRTDRKSTGLGLYLCKKAADKLAIPISAESTVGKGSCFCLDLRQDA